MRGVRGDRGWGQGGVWGPGDGGERPGRGLTSASATYHAAAQAWVGWFGKAEQTVGWGLEQAHGVGTILWLFTYLVGYSVIQLVVVCWLLAFGVGLR